MTHSEWENEDVIHQFRDWLTQTAEEVESLDDESPDAESLDDESLDDEASNAGALPAEFAAHAEANVTSILDTSTPGSCPRTASSSTLPLSQAESREGSAMPLSLGGPQGVEKEAVSEHPPNPALPEVGLLQVVEAFSAMRHELKLYTKGTRNLGASVSRSLEGLDAASRTFEAVQAKEKEAVQHVALPMVEALVGFDEGLLRAERAFQAARRQLTQTAPAGLCESLDKQLAGQRWWRRLMWRRWHAHIRDIACAASRRAAKQEFATLMQGFNMIQTRLTQAFANLRIQRLDETGGQVDPTRMTVVELVVDDNQLPETVTEVVRNGYVWANQVVRYAEVRAVASRATHDSTAP